MRLLTIAATLLFLLAVPVSAMDITAPPVPESGEALMPERAESFGEGLWQICKDAISALRPDISEAAGTCMGVIGVVMLVSVLQTFPGMSKRTAELAGVTAVAVMLLAGTNSLIGLGAQTVEELSEYGKLLLPVMTAALAAQGGITSSAALYTGTVVFNTVLSTLIARLLVPMIYLFLTLAAAYSASGQELLKKVQDLTKWLMVWGLKIILYVFTGYMGITGVVSGTTDAATLKAAKLTISGMVPVVGGILSDASEAVLVSAGMVKNTAGIYGILAVLSIFAGPFLRIGVHYLLLKATAAVCAVFGCKGMTGIVGDFSSAMGLMLAMTGSVCLLLLIGTVCFMRGVG